VKVDRLKIDEGNDGDLMIDFTRSMVGLIKLVGKRPVYK